MKLSAWLEANGKVKHSDFATRIGTSQATVTRYANGLRIPRQKHMVAIARETGGQVTATDFYPATEGEAA